MIVRLTPQKYSHSLMQNSPKWG